MYSTVLQYMSVGPGCDEGLVSQITNVQAVKKAGGAIFTFHCEGSGVLQGSRLLFCDGAEWNDTAPLCISEMIDILLNRLTM